MDNPQHAEKSSAHVRVYSRKKILLVLMISLAMSLLQVSAVNVALSSLAEGLNASTSDLQWVLSGYALAIGVVLVPAGRLGDIFGRSRLFLLGLTLFTLASVGCGLVGDPLALNLMRGVQGLSAGLFSPQITGIIQQYFAGQSRAKAFALFGLVVSASVAAGPVLSGFLIEAIGHLHGWRATFFINLPVGIVGIVAALAWLPFRDDRRRVAERRHRAPANSRLDLDPVGMLLLVAFVLSIMLPFMMGGTPWRFALLGLAALLVATWIWWEARYEARGGEPMVQLSLFKIRSFSYSTAISALQFLGMTSIFVVVTLFLQRGLHQSAMVAGMIGLPNAFASAFTAMAVGRHTIKHGRALQIGALALMILGLVGVLVILPGIEHGISFWWISVSFVVLGLGAGAMGSANQTQSMLDIPPSHGGAAGGVIQTSQRITTAIGNAIITAIFMGTVSAAAPGGTPTVHDWTVGVATAYTVIIAILLVALGVAVAFWRDRTPPPPHEIPGVPGSRVAA